MWVGKRCPRKFRVVTIEFDWLVPLSPDSFIEELQPHTWEIIIDLKKNIRRQPGVEAINHITTTAIRRLFLFGKEAVSSI